MKHTFAKHLPFFFIGGGLFWLFCHELDLRTLAVSRVLASFVPNGLCLGWLAKPGKQRDFLKPNLWQRSHKEHMLRKAHAKRLCGRAVKKRSEVDVCPKKWTPFSFFVLLKWHSDCRTEGLKTAKQYKNRGLRTTKKAHDEKRWTFSLKMALKPENGAFLVKLRPPNAGF